MDHCAHIYNSHTFPSLSLNNLAQIAYIFRKKLLYYVCRGNAIWDKNTIIEVLKVKIDRPDTRLRAGAL